MSMYMHFFIKSKDKMMPIHTVSRSNVLYAIVDEVFPELWEKVAPITRSRIDEIISDAASEIEKIDKVIGDINEKIAAVGSWVDSIENKLYAIDCLKGDADAEKECRQEYEEAISFMKTLSYMIDEAEDTKWYKEDNRDRYIDPNRYVYVGIECAYPSINQVEAWDREAEFEFD